MHPLLFHFGRIAIPTYGVLTAAALLAGLAVLVQQGARHGMGAHKVWNLGLVAILAALFGARLLLVVTHLSVFRAHPFWVLGLASVPGQWIALGGAAIGVATGALYALAEGMPLLRMADAAAPAAAVAFAVNRLGAFFGGVGWGRPTSLPWGVTYRSIVAYLWYRTPLGISLHPVQLYDAGASLAILVALMAMRTRREGEVAGAWLFLYGVCRFFVEFFRGDEAQTRVFGGFLTVAQALAIAAVLAGGALWMAGTRKPESAPAEAA